MSKFKNISPTGVTAAMMMLYLIQWGAQYIGYNFLPLYINDLPYATNGTTGLALAVGAATTALAQPIWGQIADKAKTKNRVLLISLVLEALMGALFFTILPNIWLLLIAIVLFYIPFLTPQSLIDTIVVENLNKVRVRYGVLRCFSSGGAALMAFICGIFNMSGTGAFIVFAIFSLGAILPLLFVPDAKGHARENEKKISYKELLSNHRFVLFLFYGFALFFCGSFLNTFFAIFITTDQGLNTGTEWYGIFMGITILLEAALMFLGTPLFTKMNPYVVFMFPLTFGIFRVLFLVLASGPNDIFIYLYPIFHALWFSPLWAKSAPYIQSVVPDEMRATGQSMWTIVTCGFAPIAGSLVSGLIADLFGIRQLFLLLVITMVVLSVLFAILFFRQQKIDEKEGWSMNY